MIPETLADGAFEVNEAFAAVTMAAMAEFKLPHEIVNVHGGAILKLLGQDAGLEVLQGALGAQVQLAQDVGPQFRGHFLCRQFLSDFRLELAVRPHGFQRLFGSRLGAFHQQIPRAIHSVQQGLDGRVGTGVATGATDSTVTRDGRRSR